MFLSASILFKNLNSHKMNSRQISQLFKHQDQQFNPIQTFGNRQAPQSQERGQGKSSHEERRVNNRRRDKEKLSEQQEDRDDVREQTRIKLLSSYQQSYLESISHHNFTQGDQLSDFRAVEKSNNLSYSQSKRSDTRMDHYIMTDPNEQPQQSNKFALNQNRAVQYFNQGTDASFMEKPNALSKSSQNLPPKSYVKEFKDSMRDKGQKIKQLSQAIEEQMYNLSVQDRLYQYLISRIDQRGQVRKMKDNHQVIEKAIDFMDSGEQFMKCLLKLSKMQGS